MTSGALQILHVLPHVGGGVGAVLRALLGAQAGTLRARHVHRVATLEYLNDPTRDCLAALGVKHAGCADEPLLRAWIAAADVVVLHWWNHPLLMRLLAQGLPAARLVMWSHVNGYAVPQAFFAELFDVPDVMVFSSKVSLDAPIVQSLGPAARAKLRVVRSCAGIPPGTDRPIRKEGPFRFGYLGTVEPTKMHSDFLSLCACAGMDSPCVVAGGNAHDELARQAALAGLSDRFIILGPVADPQPLLQSLHALAYPLNPSHYGTGEQVLVEAMAFGAVPVVLNNPPEKALVCHEVTGLVARNAEDFAAYLRLLADAPDTRKTLAANARAFVLEHCPIERSLEAFRGIFEEAAGLAKSVHRLELAPEAGIRQGSPFHLFLTACGHGEERSIALAVARREPVRYVPPSFALATRGAPAHYLQHLGEDVSLARLCAAAGSAGSRWGKVANTSCQGGA